jgi:hypothetical protein
VELCVWCDRKGVNVGGGMRSLAPCSGVDMDGVDG